MNFKFEEVERLERKRREACENGEKKELEN